MPKIIKSEERFLDGLREIAQTRRWEMDGDAIRSPMGSCGFHDCPITAVCFHKTRRQYASAFFTTAGRLIGLHPARSELIAAAADGAVSARNLALRKRMLGILGLKETLPHV